MAMPVSSKIPNFLKKARGLINRDRKNAATDGNSTGKRKPVLVQRGLQCKLSISFGKPESIKYQSTTGRADYFGNIVALSARVLAVSHFGQTLISAGPRKLEHAEDEWHGIHEIQWNHKDGTALYDIHASSSSSTRRHEIPNIMEHIKNAPKAKKSDSDSNSDVLFMRAIGYYTMKGITLPQLIISVSPSSLRAREHYVGKYSSPLSGEKATFMCAPDKIPS